MDSKLAYWGSVIFSAIALVLVIMNISLSNANRTLQTSVVQRQSTVAGGQTLSQLNQSIIQALAEMSYKNNNVQLRDLLAAQGITVKANDAAAASSAKTADKK
jgi:hypothetical protein